MFINSLYICVHLNIYRSTLKKKFFLVKCTTKCTIFSKNLYESIINILSIAFPTSDKYHYLYLLEKSIFKKKFNDCIYQNNCLLIENIMDLVG